jgi:hypothetical protein
VEAAVSSVSPAAAAAAASAAPTATVTRTQEVTEGHFYETVMLSSIQVMMSDTSTTATSIPGRVTGSFAQAGPTGSLRARARAVTVGSRGARSMKPWQA